MHGPLVGREREVGLLDGWLDAALAGRGRLVLCAGEPGVGKTRLAEELRHRAGGRGAAAAWAAAPGASWRPYGVWRQLAADLELELLSGDVAAADPEAERWRLFDTTAQALSQAPRGLVVVLDDVHAADDSSLALLVHLARHLSRRPAKLLLFATYRSTEHEVLGEHLAEVAREPAVEHLALAGLDLAAVGTWLAAVAGPVDRAGEIHAATGGNAFLVGELAREPPAQGPLVAPATVRGAIRRRIAALSAPAGPVLDAAAILGPEFTVGVVAAIVGRPALACLDVLGEAEHAGLVEPAGPPGRYRFVHGLVPAAVEADLPPAARNALHRAAAEAIERYYARDLVPQLGALAHHWAIVAAGGEAGHTAATWARKAGDEALRRTAWEEGARLFRLALEVGAAALDDEERAGLQRALALAHMAAGRLDDAAAACRDAADTARRLGRADLIGEAAVVLEAVGEPAVSTLVRELSDEALTGLDDGPPRLRARLLAQQVEAAVYLGDLVGLDETSSEALDLADASGDPDALIAALRARHHACSTPERVAERLALADRLAAVVRRAGRVSAGHWPHVWRIAAAFEEGRLHDVERELVPLHAAADRARKPLARWHLLRLTAIAAQAQGRFADALRHSGEALATVLPADLPSAARADAALRASVAHHVGTEGRDPVPPPPSPAAPELANLAAAAQALDAGRHDLALALWERLRPAGQPAQAPWLEVLACALRVQLAVGLERAADLPALQERLRPHRDRHVTGAGGSAIYLGPVALYLGTAARAAGDADTAVAELRRAGQLADGSGARAFAVEARVELGRALLQRDAAGDREEARTVLGRAGEDARRLGMAPFRTQAARLLAAAGGPAPASGLTAREAEVAALVARGLTNRQIADALVLSERTAQNHVQHILTKLGFSTRSQIAAWAAARDE